VSSWRCRIARWFWGPQLTGAPEETLERIPQALCGVVGEGEETFVELLRMPVRDHAALAQCQGLVFAGESGVVLTPPRPLISPVDRLSIPRSEHLTLGRMTEPPATLLTGRGCTGRCAFCFEGNASRRVNKGLRLHSVQRCLEEVDYLVRKFHPKYLTIMDDTFVADARRLREFCQEMIGRYHERVKWFCEARMDSLWRQRDLLPLMIEAGLLRIQVGGESGCQHILDAYRKGITLEQLQWFADAAGSAGLHSAYINFIIGGAFETRETARRTREFACDLIRRAPAIVAVGHSLFTPYPATPIHENPEAYGLKLLDKDVVTGFGDSHAFCRTAELTRFDILELGREFNKAVQDAMNDIAQAMPLEVADRVFEGQHKWGLEGEWYEFLSQDSRWSGYYLALHAGRAKRLGDVPTDRIEH
jgi:radical SAM superfamily enzyme YgiQ (UPF0313 family)